MNSTDGNAKTKQKKKGLLRTEAIIPFAIVALVGGLYFKFFFDSHLRKALEWVGYMTWGAEVDIASLETSFLKGSLRIQGIEVTNPDRPTHNLIKLGDIRFGLLWDGLLRAKFVVEEMAVEQIEIGSPRKQAGKVKPPEPPKKETPSAIKKEAEKIKSQALEKVEEKNSENVLGDVAAVASGASAQGQVQNVEESLPSKAKLKELEAAFQEKQKLWQERLKSLPQAKEIQSLGERLSKIKTRDFKNPQEVLESVKQVDAVLKDADAKYKLVSSTANDLDADLRHFDDEIKKMDGLVKKDISDLETRFRIPKLDAKSLTMSLLHQYTAPYEKQVSQYRALAEKYIPPNMLKKGQSEPDVQIQPRPRASGVTYEFGRPNAYPAVWIKKISVSSKGGFSPNVGDLKGLVTDISSNQVLTGKPTMARFDGDFPGLNINGIDTKLLVDNRHTESLIAMDFSVASYGMDGREVLNSPDAKISFKKATSSVKSHVELRDLTKLNLNINNQIQKIDYDISAKNEIVDQILKEVFANVPVVTIEATAHGDLPGVSFDISSNLGPELQKGFERQIKKKIEETKAKLMASINEAIGKEKAKFEADYNKTKSQIDGEIKKVTDQLNKQKSQGESKMDQAKKDSENQGKKNVESQGQKALDDLKKKFGL